MENNNCCSEAVIEEYWVGNDHNYDYYAIKCKRCNEVLEDWTTNKELKVG